MVELKTGPALICLPCLEDLNQAVLFRDRIIKADDKFRSKIPQNILTEVIENQELILYDLNSLKEVENYYELESIDLPQKESNILKNKTRNARPKTVNVDSKLM